MEETPLITVVIPVYNIKEYLPKCINSVLGQEYKNLEIILIDDGSTDESGLLCDKYAEKHKNITVIHQNNKGLGGARNTGIDNASGQFIFFLDSDDYLCKKYIKILFDYISKNNLDVAFGGHNIVNEKGQCIHSMNLKEKSDYEDAFDFALRNKYVPTMAWGKLYKTKLFQEHNIRFTEHRFYEDVNTVYKVFYYTNKVIQIPYNGYFWLQRDYSISRNITTKHIEDMFLNLSDVENFLKENNIWNKYFNAFQHRYILFSTLLVEKIELYDNNNIFFELYLRLNEKFNSAYFPEEKVREIFKKNPNRLLRAETLMKIISVLNSDIFDLQKNYIDLLFRFNQYKKFKWHLDRIKKNKYYRLYQKLKKAIKRR